MRPMSSTLPTLSREKYTVAKAPLDDCGFNDYKGVYKSLKGKAGTSKNIYIVLHAVLILVSVSGGMDDVPPSPSPSSLPGKGRSSLAAGPCYMTGNHGFTGSGNICQRAPLPNKASEHIWA